MKISSKMVDSEDIIRAVKKHRAVWDLGDEGYHNKQLKEDAWNGVCIDLYPNWKILTEEERYAKQLLLKKRWNNIRDYYKKLLSEQPPGEQVRAKKRRYLYSEILEFIRPVYDKVRQETAKNAHNSFIEDSCTFLSENDSDEQAQESTNDTQDMETDTFIGIPTRNSSSTISASPQPVTPTYADIPSSKNSASSPIQVTRPNQRRIIRLSPRRKKRSSQLTVFERSIIKSLEAIKAPQNEDPDLCFLKSLLPDMKKLSDTQKLDFKLGIMELYKNILSSSNDQTDISNEHDYELDYSEVKVEGVRLSVDEDLSS